MLEFLGRGCIWVARAVLLGAECGLGCFPCGSRGSRRLPFLTGRFLSPEGASIPLSFEMPVAGVDNGLEELDHVAEDAAVPAFPGGFPSEFAVQFLFDVAAEADFVLGALVWHGVSLNAKTQRREEELNA